MYSTFPQHWLSQNCLFIVHNLFESFISGDSKDSSPKKAAASISHLVKKRKKSEEEGEKADNGEVKKPHLEEATNGSNGTAATTASNGTNGH